MRKKKDKKKDRKKRTWRFRKRKLTNIAILPTLVTLGNLVVGVFAIINAIKGYHFAELGDLDKAQSHFWTGAWFIFFGMVFDALDGRVARMTNTASNFGAQLDSLCDLITFGVAPAMLVWVMYTTSSTFLPAKMVTAVCAFYVVCAAVRLARFNIETDTDLKSHMEFAGLPSPASAGFIAACIIPWNAYKDFAFLTAISNAVLAVLPILLLLIAVLMISRVPYVHVLNKLFKAPRPFFVFVEVMLVVLFAILFHEFAIFVAFAGYAVSGPVVWIRRKTKRKDRNKSLERAPEETLF